MVGGSRILIAALLLVAGRDKIGGELVAFSLISVVFIPLSAGGKTNIFNKRICRESLVRISDSSNSISSEVSRDFGAPAEVNSMILRAISAFDLTSIFNLAFLGGVSPRTF